MGSHHTNPIDAQGRNPAVLLRASAAIRAFTVVPTPQGLSQTCHAPDLSPGSPRRARIVSRGGGALLDPWDVAAVPSRGYSNVVEM